MKDHENEDEFISNLDRFSYNKVKNKDDVKFLYRSALEKNLIDDFEKTTFTAKYINGLKRVLQTGTGNPEISNIEQIRKDLSDNYEKIIDEIKHLSGGGNEEVEIFKDKYLRMNQESFLNLNSLLADLEWVKIYLNDKKRK